MCLLVLLGIPRAYYAEGGKHPSRLRRRRRQPLEELLPRADLDPDLLEVVRVEDLRGREVVDLVRRRAPKKVCRKPVLEYNR